MFRRRYPTKSSRKDQEEQMRKGVTKMVPSLRNASEGSAPRASQAKAQLT